ncbi:MAG: hypothetical protein EHM55_24175 [Acidobacteria bacterium]|nr:MAG: hypothetical protein EHM55_24175 [Acidobacteriota bacterium]
MERGRLAVQTLQRQRVCGDRIQGGGVQPPELGLLQPAEHGDRYGRRRTGDLDVECREDVAVRAEVHLLAVGGWWLVVGGWWLVVGWSFVESRGCRKLSQTPGSQQLGR